jgi:hypothetical protein
MTEAMGGANPILGEMGRGIKGVTGLFFDMAEAEAIALAPFIIIAASIAAIAVAIESAKEKTKEIEKENAEWIKQQKELDKLLKGDSEHSAKYDKLSDKLEEMKEKARDAMIALQESQAKGGGLLDGLTGSDDTMQAQIKYKALQQNVDRLTKALKEQGETDAAEKQAKQYEHLRKAVEESQKEVDTYGLTAREKRIKEAEWDAHDKGMDNDPETKAMINRLKWQDSWLTGLENEKKKEEETAKAAEQHAKTIATQWQSLQNEYLKLTDKHSEKDIKLAELTKLGATADELKSFSDLLDKIEQQKANDKGLQGQLSAMESMTKEAERLLSIEDQTQLKREEWKKKLGDKYGGYSDLIERLIAPKQQSANVSPYETSKRADNFQAELLKGNKDDTPKLTLQEMQKLRAAMESMNTNGVKLKAG